MNDSILLKVLTKLSTVKKLPNISNLKKFNIFTKNNNNNDSKMKQPNISFYIRIRKTLSYKKKSLYINNKIYIRTLKFQNQNYYTVLSIIIK